MQNENSAREILALFDFSLLKFCLVARCRGRLGVAPLQFIKRFRCTIVEVAHESGNFRFYSPCRTGFRLMLFMA
jgi:hypothetical protein